MPHVTYTLLVTVEPHAGEHQPMIDELEQRIQKLLESAEDGGRSVASALVHAVQGDRVMRSPVTISRMNSAKVMHEDLRGETAAG